MGYGNCVLTLVTPENMEVVGEAGVPYIDEFDLAEKLQRVLRDGSLVQAYRNRAQQRIQTHYAWDNVVDQYEQLFARMCGQAPPPEPPSPEAPQTLQTIQKQSA
jgi:glycosyltransferase involved in cell wall biosynthesis